MEVPTLSVAEMIERHAGWWRRQADSCSTPLQERTMNGEIGLRKLKLGRSIDVDVPFSFGALGQLRCSKEPVNQRIPTQKRISEVGFYSEWLSSNADVVTADVAASNVAGQSLQLTGCVSLDDRRHSVLSASAGANSFDVPRLDVKLDNRRFNLLLERPVMTQYEGSWDASRGIHRFASTSATMCCSNKLQLALLCGTNLTASDVGLDVVLMPGGDADRRGLHRLSAAAISALDGRSKQLTVAGTYRVNGSGAELDGSLESAEGAEWRRLQNPLSWNLGLSAPAPSLYGFLQLEMRGGANQVTALSATLTPGGSNGGLTVKLYHDIASDWRQRSLGGARETLQRAPSLISLPQPPLLPPSAQLHELHQLDRQTDMQTDRRRQSFVMGSANSSCSSDDNTADAGLTESDSCSRAAPRGTVIMPSVAIGKNGCTEIKARLSHTAANMLAADHPPQRPTPLSGVNSDIPDSVGLLPSNRDGATQEEVPGSSSFSFQAVRGIFSPPSLPGSRSSTRRSSFANDSHIGAPAGADDVIPPAERHADVACPEAAAHRQWQTPPGHQSAASDTHSPTSGIAVEWRLGNEEDWITSEYPMFKVSAQLQRGWVGSCAKIDMLLPF